MFRRSHLTHEAWGTGPLPCTVQMNSTIFRYNIFPMHIAAFRNVWGDTFGYCMYGMSWSAMMIGMKGVRT